MFKDSSAMYYQKRQKNQGTDLKKSRERYQNLLEEKKKWEYSHERYKNLSKNEQEKDLAEYRKRYYEMQKNKILL